MKLSELLEEVKVGTEEFKESQTAENLLETFDEDIDNYRISKVLGAMINKLEEDVNEDTAPTIRALRRAYNKIDLFEKKMEDAGIVSKAYARMRLDSLVEEYNTVLESVHVKKVARQLNKEALAHALGLVRHQQENLAGLAEVENFEVKEATSNFQPLIDKEYLIISEAFA